jgi:DNA (cytosine-5)-methyltransferase 1
MGGRARVKAAYNEIDPYCCAWLSNLMDAGLITPGVIINKSIEDVYPDELRGFDRVHLFAGIGVWDYALTRAGWRGPAWTLSCPCQPFSAAGEGRGFADERHLWPDARWLIRECKPRQIFGEQVAGKDAEPWLDLVSTELEALGFAFGALAFPSAGIGAPHIRDRTYFVADADYARPQGWWGVQERADKRAARARGVARGMDDASCVGRETGRGDHAEHDGIVAGATDQGRELADAANVGFDGRGSGEASDGRDAARIESERLRFVERIESAGPANGFWRTADWLLCRDEKWRAVEPGTFPLADGAPARVGRLRAYGNAINAEAAVAFIQSADEAMKEGAALYHPGFRSSVVVAN